jgi:hypothetical protein
MDPISKLPGTGIINPVSGGIPATPITHNITPIHIEPADPIYPSPVAIQFYPVCKNIPECKVNVTGDYVITTQEELTTLWSSMYPIENSRPPLPAVDFNKATLLATFSGLGNSTAGTKEIEKIWYEGGNNPYIVNIRGYGVLDGCIKPLYPCNIFHIVAINKTSRPISFFHYTPGLYQCFV